MENEDGMQLALALSVSEGDLGISNGDADVASGDTDYNDDEASSDDESNEYDPSESRSMDEIYAAALAHERKKKRKLHSGEKPFDPDCPACQGRHRPHTCSRRR